MRKHVLTLFVFLALAGGVSAQQFTTVTSTIVDSAGTAYALGNYSINLVNTSGQQPTLGGNANFQQTFRGTLTVAGFFSVSLPSVTQMFPLGMQWAFNICANPQQVAFQFPAVSIPCFTYTSTGTQVSGTSVDLSSSMTPTVIPKTPTTSSSNTFTGTVTTTGALQPKNFDGIKYVDQNNVVGWAGTDEGLWANSAISSLGQPGEAVLAPGNPSSTATTVTLPDYISLRPEAVFYSSTACPNFSLTGAGSTLIGAGTAPTTIFNSCTSTNGAINIGAGATFPRVHNLKIQGQSGSFDGITIQDNQHFATFEDVFIKPASGGRCFNQVAGASGTVFTRLNQVYCIGGTGPAYNFDNSGSGNAGNWELFDNVYAVGIGGNGIGFQVANGSATFNRTGVDSSTTGYKFGNTGTNGTARILMLNSDDESETNGVDIEGPGDYTLVHHNCGILTGTCINVNAAANTTLIDPASQSGTGTDIIYTANATGTNVIIGGSGLTATTKITKNAAASYTQISNDVLTNGAAGTANGRICSGTCATGSIAGDSSSQRSATTGVNYLGSDGNVFFFRDASTEVLLAGSHFRFSADNTFDIGANGANRPKNGWFSGTLSTTGLLTPTNLLISSTAPTIAAAGCGGAAAAVSVNNGTAAFKINVGTTPSSACTITMPAATTGWNCFATDITTNSTSVFLQKQTGAESTTSVTITNFNDVAVATAFVASDILKVACTAD